MMKYTFLVLFFLLFSDNARAVCSGGFDGANAIFEGCSEMGGLGDVVYKRDANGKALGQRNDEEIRKHLVSTVEERLKGRGMTMKNKDGQTSIVISSDNIVFDVFNQNGDLVFKYTIDLENGIPENEKDLISSRESYNVRKTNRNTLLKEYLDEIQTLGDKIKAEEIDTKAAAKK